MNLRVNVVKNCGYALREHCLMRHFFKQNHKSRLRLIINVNKVEGENQENSQD